MPLDLEAIRSRMEEQGYGTLIEDACAMLDEIGQLRDELEQVTALRDSYAYELSTYKRWLKEQTEITLALVADLESSRYKNERLLTLLRYVAAQEAGEHRRPGISNEDMIRVYLCSGKLHEITEIVKA